MEQRASATALSWIEMAVLAAIAVSIAGAWTANVEAERFAQRLIDQGFTILQDDT